MGESNERREYLRADLNVFVNEETRTARNLAKAVDISERGVLYLLPAESPSRDTGEVSVEFSLPEEDHPIRALGKVVYDSRDGRIHRTGIQFTLLDSVDAERIRCYVGRRKRAELFEQLREHHLDN